MNPVELAIALLLFVLSLINGAVESVGWTPTPVPAETGAETAASGLSDGFRTAEQVWDAAFQASGSVTWANEAVAVSRCESGWNVRAVGAAGEEGAMQVRAIYHGEVGATLREQMKQAWRIYQRSGWRPWSCREVLR